MSIEGKHAYRFGYLKSEHWSTVRLEALAREKGKCQICFNESIYNDAHHIWYPKNIYETTERHLVILCRPCHEFIHEMFPECKHSDEEKGIADWVRFRNAILVWRRQSIVLFQTVDGLTFPNPKSLRDELARVKTQLSSYQQSGKILSKKDVGKILYNIKVMVDSYYQSAASGNLDIAVPPEQE